MSGLPQGWRLCEIGEIASIKGGGTPPSKDESNFAEGEGIPWITPADLSGYKKMYIARGRRNLTQKGFDACSAVMLPKGAVLFSSRAPVGYVAIAENEVATNQGFKSFVFPPEFDSRYVYYYLRHIKPIAEMMATGTTFKELSGANAARLPFLVAPFDEQKRIADKLDCLLAAVDTCKARLDAIPAILKRFRQSVLAAATSGKLTEEWRGGVPPPPSIADQLRCERSKWWRENGKGKYQEPANMGGALPEMPLLPRGWSWMRAEEVCASITKGTTPPKDEMSCSGDVPYVKVYNLTFDGNLDFTINPTFVSKRTNDTLLARSRVYPGDVLMNIVGPPLGKVSVVPATYPIWNINQAIAVFRPMTSLMSEYLTVWLLGHRAQSWAQRKAKATAGQFNLTLEICRDLPIPVPPPEEQVVICSRVNQLFAQADQFEGCFGAAAARVDELVGGFLRKAFQGELVLRNFSTGREDAG